MKTISDLLIVSPIGIEEEAYLPPAEKILSGLPAQNIWNVYSSPDGKFHSGVWDSQAGKWAINYTEEEYCLILEGESILTDEAGQSKTVTVGDQFVVPAGFKGTWEVPTYCKKTYVIYEAQ